MKVKNYPGAVGDNRQLLDVSSDYNNFSNLAYFISEYKKAKQIIAQCKDFYRNFLRNKLYSFDDLKNIENINLLRFNVNWETYLNNCKQIYLFMVNKYLEEQINSNLKTYHFGFYKDSIYKSEYWEREHNNNVWEVRGDKCTLLSCVESYKYWNYLYDIFILKKWNAHTTDEQSFQFDTFYKDALNLSEVNENNKEINKFNKTEITRYDREGWGDNAKIVVHKHPITVVMFGDEEKKLFEIFEEAGNKFYPIYEQIKYHPEKYLDEWKELNEFIQNNYKIIKTSKEDLTYASNETLAEIEKKKTHKGLLFPVDYYIGKKQYAIDAYKFINWDYVKYHENDRKHYWDDEKRKDYNPVYENLLNCNLKTISLIKATELLYYIQTVNPDYYKAKDSIFNPPKKVKKNKKPGDYIEPDDYDDHPSRNKSSKEKNNPYLVNNSNYYYVLIDNIPYKFTDNLSDVKIEYNESDNILVCHFFKEYKYQKWSWPSDTPYTVEQHTFTLKFDCATNEPIYYNYRYNTHEEKISYR